MHIFSTFDIKALFILGFEFKFADRNSVAITIKRKDTNTKTNSGRKLRMNSDLVRLLGKNKVLDLLNFFEAEAHREELKNGTDN